MSASQRAPLPSARVVSSVALRPSTVYVLHVASARREWRVRRCFADFCALRDKLLAPATAFWPASRDSRPNRSESRAKSPPRQATRNAPRLAFLLEEFPAKRWFWPRSLTQRRAAALDVFLQQALELAREAHASQQIAVYFSLRTHLEMFLDCAKHAVASCSAAGRPTLAHYPVKPIPSECKTSKWKCAADRWRGSPDSDSDSDSVCNCPSLSHSASPLHGRRLGSGTAQDVDEKLLGMHMAHLDISRQLRPCPRVSNPFDADRYNRADAEDEQDDPRSELEAIHLRKAASAVTSRETHEMALYYTGNYIAPLQKGEAQDVTASAAWATQIEIAGLRAMSSKQSAPLRVAVPIHPQLSRTWSWRSVGSTRDRGDCATVSKGKAAHVVLHNDNAKRFHRSNFTLGCATPADYHPECAKPTKSE